MDRSKGRNRDGQTDEWTDQRAGIETDEWTDKRAGIETDEWTDKRAGTGTDAVMDRQTVLGVRFVREQRFEYDKVTIATARTQTDRQIQTD